MRGGMPEFQPGGAPWRGQPFAWNIDLTTHLLGSVPNNDVPYTVWQIGPLGVPAGARVAECSIEYRMRAGVNAACFVYILANQGAGWAQYGATRFHNSGDPTMAGQGSMKLSLPVVGTTALHLALNVQVDSGGGGFSTYPAGYGVTWWR